ncbi:MAG TPA: NYN domain-containing protein, partial [Candidatus Bathyarchaeia archaeon]|nr:NYN domain-containing protein [Candidatus Bathyarchaeia archaeon]
MGKNVAVFVDVANIFYAAKAAGTDIDYVTLLKAATAGRDFVRAYAYTGLDPDNENQRNFHAFLARNHYKVVSKDIRKYGDGKVKANLDIELVVDMMKTARNLDVAIVVSGDGDFAPAIRAVQEMGVRVEVISFRGNTSSDLIEVADLFTDITQLARVDKGSSRSGRRVAGDEEDLSMTEVPDKQTEGTGTRSRGRGRGRLRPGEAEPIAARGRPAPRSTVTSAPAAAAVGGNGSLTVMPGEKLARVVGAPGAEGLEDEEPAALEPEAEGDVALEGSADGDEAGRRRRRRRGGRGRGRG